MRPLVTIGIPTFNRARQLAGAVESALAQDYENLEILISDNASPDETPEICAAARKADSRVRLVRHDTNIGAVRNFHQLPAAAQGAYFMWLADDDRLQENYVSSCVEVLEANPEVALVAGRARFLDDSGLLLYEERALNLTAPSGEDRVAAFFRNVFDNSVFYGLSPTERLLSCLPATTPLAYDWKVVSSLAYRGHVRTLEATRLLRVSGGTSASVRAITRSFDAGWFTRLAPYTSIAMTVGRHLLSNSVFDDLEIHRRWRLSALAVMTILIRFWPRQWYRLLWLRWRK